MSTMEENIAEEINDAPVAELLSVNKTGDEDKPDVSAVSDVSDMKCSDQADLDVKGPKNPSVIATNGLCTSDGKEKSLVKLEPSDLQSSNVDGANESQQQADNEPVQVQKVDSSEKAPGNRSATNGSEGNVSEREGNVSESNSNTSCQFLIRLSQGSQFIVPGNLLSIQTSKDDPSLVFPNSMPPSLIQILPTVLSEASAAVLDQKDTDKSKSSILDENTSKNDEEGAPKMNENTIITSSSMSSLYIKIPSTSMTADQSPSMSNMLIQLQPLNPADVISSNAQVVGPPSSPSRCAAMPTFLITFGECKDEFIKENKAEDNQSQSKLDEGSTKSLVIDSPLDILTPEMFDECNSKDALNLDTFSQSLKLPKEKNLKLKRKRRRRKKGGDASFVGTDKPKCDRLICSLCPEPLNDPNKSQELNCNEVGPNYGIRITQNVSRCFVCTVELKNLREVWAHADTPNHKQKVHNLLTNQSLKKQGSSPRKTSGTAQRTPDSDSTAADEESQSNTPTTSSNTKITSKTKYSGNSSSEVVMKTDIEIKEEPIDEVAKIDFENMEMPKLREQTTRVTRKRPTGSAGPSYKSPKRRSRCPSNSSTESIPILEKITWNINTCPVCETEFDNVVQKLDHAMAEHSEYQEVLEVLSSVVHSSREGEYLRACVICKKVYNGIENLLSHLIAVHQIKARTLENVDMARLAIQGAIQKKQKPEHCDKMEETPEKRKIVAIEDITDMSEFSATKCLYCNRTYTTTSRLESHYKSTGHRKLLLAKKGRQKKECHHCHKVFKSAVACKIHLRRTVPDKNSGPCKSRAKEMENLDSKKQIVRVPGGGIKDAILANNSLTCQTCNEAFSTIHTFQLHSRTTSPTKAGCVPLTPSFKAGGAKPMYPAADSPPPPNAEVPPAPSPANNVCDICDKSFDSSDELKDHKDNTYASQDGKNCVLKIEESEIKELESTVKMETDAPATGQLPEADDVATTSAAAAVTCDKCLKAFNSPYALKMHLALTTFKERAKACVRRYYRKKTVGVVRFCLKKRKPAKKKRPKNFKAGDSIKNEIKEEEVITEDKNEIKPQNYEFKELGESFFPQVKLKPLSIEGDNISDRFSANEEVKNKQQATDAPVLGTEELNVAESAGVEDDDVAKARHRASRGSMYTEKDCHCRICFKALSTPWNRNAHERNVHNYDHKFSSPTSMTGSLPTMVPLPSATMSSNPSLFGGGDSLHRYQCMTCHQYFDDPNELKKHYVESKHGIGVAGINEEKKCKYCKKTFSSMLTRNLHNRNTVPIVKSGKCIPIAVLTNQLATFKADTSCQVCNKELTTAVSKVKHENVVHRSYFMRKYGKLPASKSRRDKQVTSSNVKEQKLPQSQKEAGGATKSCKICNKEFYSASQLQMHYATADHNKSVASESSRSSPKVLPTAKSPLVDTLSHGKPKKKVKVQSKEDRTCKYCLKVFAKVWNRKFHEENVHRDGRPANRSPNKRLSKKSIPNSNKSINISGAELVQPASSSTSTPIPEFPFLKSTPSMTVIPLSDGNEPPAMTAPSKPQHPWVCVKCNRVYSSEERLDKHYTITNHNEGLPKPMPALQTCGFCKKSFKSVRALRIHESITVPRPDKGRCVYKVGIEALENQQSQNVDPTSKICKYCQRTFSTSWHRRVHEVQSHVVKKPEGKSKRKANRAHNSRPIVPIDEQTVVLKKPKWFYSNHDGKLVPMDSNMVKRLCRVCNKVFTTIWYMRAHVRRNHPHVFERHFSQEFPEEDNSNDPIVCVLATPRQYSKANSAPSTPSVMKSLLASPAVPVMNSPPVIRPANTSPLGNNNRTITIHNCKICCRQFKWKTALEEHLLTCTTDSLAFKCRICGVMFKERRQLGPHWRKHQRNEDSDMPSLEMFVALDKFGVTVEQQQQSRASISHTARMKGRDLTMQRSGIGGGATSSANNQDGNKPGGKHLECYRCTGCNKIFMNAVKFIQHRLTHFSESSVTEISDKKPFCCEVCNMVSLNVCQMSSTYSQRFHLLGTSYEY